METKIGDAYQTLLKYFGTLMIISKDDYRIMSNEDFFEKDSYMNTLKAKESTNLSYQIGNYLVTIQELPQEKGE